jgi:hypothetical protein
MALYPPGFHQKISTFERGEIYFSIFYSAKIGR